MNFRASSRRRTVEVVLDITPLVDVVFQLLVFFVLTTTFAYDAGIQVDIPKASSGVPGTARSDVIVAIDRDGNWIYEHAVRSRAELEGLLSEKVREASNDPVVIQADEHVAHGKVVELMDLVQTVGFKHLAIATAPESR